MTTRLVSAFFAALFGLAVGGRLPAVETSPASAETAVRVADEAWAKAIAAKSLDQTLTFYDPEVMSAGTAMFPACGLPAFRENWTKILVRPDFALTWKADRVVVTESGTIACSSGTWTVPGSQDEGPYLAVWRKQPNGQWKVLVDAAWKTNPPPAADVAEARVALEAYILQFWNKHDTTALARAFPPTMVYHYNGEIIPGTPEDHLGYLKDFGGAFPDLVGTIDRFAFSDGIGAASTTWTGTHKGELDGVAVTGNKSIPPTGRKVTIATNYVFRVEEGRIVELWETWDEGTLYLKLSQPEPALTAR